MVSQALTSDRVPTPDGDAEALVRLRHLETAPVKAAICLHSAVVLEGKPRSAPVLDYLDRRVWSIPTAYCLLWDPGSEQQTEVYVGSTGDPLYRFRNHKQEGWSHAVFLTSYELTRGMAQQLEAALGNVLVAGDEAHARLLPAWDQLPSLWEAEMPWHLLRPMVVLLQLCFEEVGVQVNLSPADATEIYKAEQRMKDVRKARGRSVSADEEGAKHAVPAEESE